MLNNTLQSKRSGKMIKASGIVIASVAAVILLALLITYVTNSDRYGSLSDFVTDMVHLSAFRIEYYDGTGNTDDAQRPCSLAQKWALYTFTDRLTGLFTELRYIPLRAHNEWMVVYLGYWNGDGLWPKSTRTSIGTGYECDRVSMYLETYYDPIKKEVLEPKEYYFSFDHFDVYNYYSADGAYVGHSVETTIQMVCFIDIEKNTEEIVFTPELFGADLTELQLDNAIGEKPFAFQTWR